MNNTQFRRLVLHTPQASGSNVSSKDGALPRAGATPALGSRNRSSIPMTPRTVAGSSTNDFTRQLAERNAELNPSQLRKFKSSAAPKGTKLGAGYQDRTQFRTSGEEDDKAMRVKALEDMVKLGQMEQRTFEALRDEIIGGDIKNVHLVKGLDFKLLERVRHGEDVLADSSQSDDLTGRASEKGAEEVNVDDEFEKLEGQTVQPLAKEEKSKKGEMAPPLSVAGKKRTRDDILKDLRASRLAAAAEKKKLQPALGPRFSRVGEKKDTSRIEKDERGREVLITVDADGNVKRKVKKAKIEESSSNASNLPMPDKDVKPLGMDVVAVAPDPISAEQLDDGDIFEGVGMDYDPLGDAGSEDDSDDEGTAEEASTATGEPSTSVPPLLSGGDTSAAPTAAALPAPKGNYFNDSDHTDDKSSDTPHNPLTDPAILAALKKASTINPFCSAADNEEELAKLARRKKMLDSHDRDADDMDVGFGGGRFDDEEDGGDEKIKLSVWGQDGGEEGKGREKEKKKRGGKKRKGDVNSAADVLKVMERRKGEDK